ncbi:MAG TPA: NADH-quinone oxidoreductase subunit H [Myxococcota bacterium]|nr:NADH-quinone oxidoreductase subunit H [Myxococcota bacterium]
MIDLPVIIVHFALLLGFPPLLLGVINKTKAKFAGRRGPPLLQAYYDLARLLRKQMVVSRTTTWIFRAGPVIALSSALLAGALVPFGAFDAPLRFTGDFVLFAYLLALGRFFTAAAALDTGSAFEGMGAARDVSFACLAEAALFVAFVVLVRLSGALSLTPMLHAPIAAPFHGLPTAALALVAVALFVVLLVENARVPIDDPNTHLELTMIHEVMLLDHSGPLLGVALYAASLKLFLLSALLLHLVAPFALGSPALDWLAFAAGLVAIAIGIGVVESVMARLRLRYVPSLLIASTILCVFGFVLTLA